MKVKFNSLKVVIFVIFFSPTMEGISQTIQTKDEVDINSKQYLFFRNMIDSFTYSPNKNKGLLQSSATYQSFYGNYDKALYYFSEVEPPFSFPFKAEKLKQYVPKPYIEILDSLAKTNRIIIFNEAHHVPQHRITTLNSLKILYKNGFRYLALEALGNDSSINILKYPLFNKDGFLINEPCYGDLVREALKIGFKVISYDIASKDVKTREITEAQNIYNKILKKDSNAKIVIHCGFSHGFDKKIEDNPDFSMMGYYLKEISNIDPLFINQVSTSERLPKLRQRSDYTFFSDSFHFKTPSFFFSNEKGYWKGEPWDGDMVLFLPLHFS